MPVDIENDLFLAIKELLKQHSASEISTTVKHFLKNNEDRELTIIVNEGMHSIPDEMIRGDKLVFSFGTLDLSEEMVEETISQLMIKAHETLSRRLWNKIYLIPSGHPLLVVAATMICYRTIRIDPIVVSYFDGNYIDVPLNIRQSVLSNKI